MGIGGKNSLLWVYSPRLNKLKEYQEAGITEYWIIDPRPGKLRADFYRLNEAGQYELVLTTLHSGGKYGQAMP